MAGPYNPMTFYTRLTSSYNWPEECHKSAGRRCGVCRAGRGVTRIKSVKTIPAVNLQLSPLPEYANAAVVCRATASQQPGLWTGEQQFLPCSRSRSFVSSSVPRVGRHDPSPLKILPLVLMQISLEVMQGMYLQRDMYYNHRAYA